MILLTLFHFPGVLLNKIQFGLSLKFCGICVRVCMVFSMANLIRFLSGTAVESLASMQSFLRGRPSTFNSLEHAIEWRYRFLSCYI